MRILITNDDGIGAHGIRVLSEVASRFGEVKVVAPDRERSACGHSMTMRDPLRVKAVEYGELEAYEVSGVPVDCINVGLTLAWPDGCDLVLSGFNHGPNLGYDVTYSGTVAGAMEGCINGIKSISLSMACFESHQPLHLETGGQWLLENFMRLYELEVPAKSFINVNVPAVPFASLVGSRVVPMGGRVYEDRVEMRDDPWGKPYYWQGGVKADGTVEPNTDLEAVTEGFVSISPLQIDWTNRSLLEQMQTQFDSFTVSRSL